MLRLDNKQASLWESVLPPELFGVSEELAKIDKILDDERFFAPFMEKFYSRVGRPTIPVATYLRMMYLKRRYKLGYEALVKEVNDSFTWRFFCHIPLNNRAPDDTTLIKLTKKYGENTLDKLNYALTLKLKEEKVIKGKKLRMDTMVTEANIHYPSDTGLLADGIRVITRTVVKLRKVGAKIGNGFVNHTRKVKKTCLSVSKLLKKRISKDDAGLVKAKRQIIEIAKMVIASGREVETQVEELGEEQSPIISRLAEQLNGWIEGTERIVEQTEAVLNRHLSLPQRVVSIFDTGARPIKRGKVRGDTEFGRKVLIGETDHGIITTHKVLKGNPADATLLKTGVRGHRQLFRKRLKAVATDRGFYSKSNEKWLKESGVKQVSIPVRGKASEQKRKEQKQPWFRRLQRFRAGSEGRISLLKRVFSLDKSLMSGNQGAEIWVGQGIFAHNLWQAARIM
ncbi:MAG: ISNCY family transposase [Chloroflexi bacterium]|nr:MAG: ISNCY family transposase [Chloroflexota bacterium]